MTNKVLIIDDEKDTLDICKRFLEDKFKIYTAVSFAKAEKILSQEDIDCLITDLVIPNSDGLKFVKEFQYEYADIPVIVMSGKATVKMAVEAMQLGAFDFIEKPIVNYEILTIMVEKALKSKNLQKENKLLKKKLKSQLEGQKFIGISPRIQKILQIVKKIANLNTTILIVGKTGTGKELLSKMIHENSNRKQHRFVPVNCGALPENLLESNLFGHAKGAFTGAIKETKGLFEEANKGTLFLDEIGETSPAFQVKLLRVLQEKKIRRVGSTKEISVDVRIIAATNKNLENLVDKNKFRKDLFYRLNVIRIDLPDLKDRKEDIPLLAQHFLKKFMRENEIKGYVISDKAMDFMKKAQWDGNIRELQNVIEYSAALCHNKTIKIEDFPDYLIKNKKNFSDVEYPLKFDKAKNIFEQIYFSKLIETANGKMNKAAELSELTRQYIWQKLKDLDINKK